MKGKMDFSIRDTNQYWKLVNRSEYVTTFVNLFCNLF